MGVSFLRHPFRTQAVIASRRCVTIMFPCKLVGFEADLSLIEWIQSRIDQSTRTQQEHSNVAVYLLCCCFKKAHKLLYSAFQLLRAIGKRNSRWILKEWERNNEKRNCDCPSRYRVAFNLSSGIESTLSIFKGRKIIIPGRTDQEFFWTFIEKQVVATFCCGAWLRFHMTQISVLAVGATADSFFVHSFPFMSA